MVLGIFASGIDGLYANTYGDLRVLLGTETYKRMTQIFQADSARSIWEYMRALGVGMEASGIIPDVADPTLSTNKVQEAIMTSRGSDLVIPVWEGISMIRDPYTGAAKGETALTAHMLANMTFVRKAAWKRIGFRWLS